MAQAIEKFGETFGIGSLHPGRAEGSVPRFMSRPTPDGASVEAFLLSTMVVGLAEIGDKTQILSLMLAARFLRPLPIIFGIFLATIANHAAAGLAGTYFGSLLSGRSRSWPSRCGRYSRTNTKTMIRQSVGQERLRRRSSPSFLRRSATRRKSPRSPLLHGSSSSIRSS